MQASKFYMQSGKFFLCKLVLFLSFFTPELLFAQTEGGKFEPVYATVLQNGVNIRSGQGLNFETLGRLQKNSQVIVTGQEYQWCKIKLPEEASCFIHKDYIENGIVKANRLRVRAGKGANFNILGTLKRGEVVEILSEEGDWLKIAPPDTCSGWIKKDYLRLSKKKPVPKTSKTPPTSKEKIEASGTIDDLGNIINQEARHKLIGDKEVLYYLKSDEVDLNRYVYQKVYVKGTLQELANSAYAVIKVEEIRPKQ